MKINDKLTKIVVFILVLTLLTQISFADSHEFDVETEIDQMVKYYQENISDIDWELSLALSRVSSEFNFTPANLKLNKDSFNDQKATFYGSRILTLIAMDENPYDFQGRNLVKELSNMDDEGVFGSVYDQVYSILALRASGVDIKPDIIQGLVDMQLDDGGFGFSTSDPDSAGLALVALANYKDSENVSECIEDTLNYLENAQLDTGGFASYGDENSNSISKVISALVALGEDPLDQRWIKSGNTMFDALRRFKIDNGGYRWTLDESENNFHSFKQVLMAYTDYQNKNTIYDSLRADLEVSLRIEGINQRILNTTKKVSVYDKGFITTKDFLQEALDESNIDYEITTGSSGSYISSVNGIEAGKFGNGDGWLYVINNESGLGIDNDILSYGDEVVLYYGAMAPKTLVPEVEISPENITQNNQATFKISSTYQEYDENWNATEVSTPIEGVTLEINDKKYISDDDGVIVIEGLNSGQYQYSLHKNREDDVPAILRTYGTIEVKEDFIFNDHENISNWAKEVVYDAYSLGLMNGYNNKFTPKESLTRAEAVSVLLRVKNIESEEIEDVSFNDVSDEDWFYKDISKAVELGLVSGVSETEFKPNEEISREQLAAIINNAYNLELIEDVNFDDFENISNWAKESVKRVSSNKIIVGSNNNFNPNQEVTREMAAAIFYRLTILE
ncbi:MAG: S-layer homology domain-containing protein [Clostridia bacterium]